MRKFSPNQKFKIEADGVKARSEPAHIRAEDRELLDLVFSSETIRFIDILRRLRWEETTTNEVVGRLLIRGWIEFEEEHSEDGLLQEEKPIHDFSENNGEEVNHLAALLARYAKEDEALSPVLPSYPEVPPLEETSVEDVFPFEHASGFFDNDVEAPKEPAHLEKKLTDEEVDIQADALFKAMGLGSNAGAETPNFKKPPVTSPGITLEQALRMNSGGEVVVDIPAYELPQVFSNKESELIRVTEEKHSLAPSARVRVPTEDLSEASKVRRKNREKLMGEFKLIDSQRQEAQDKAAALKQKEEEIKKEQEEHRKKMKEEDHKSFRNTIRGRAERLKEWKLNKEKESKSEK